MGVSGGMKPRSPKGSCWKFRKQIGKGGVNDTIMAKSRYNFQNLPLGRAISISQQGPRGTGQEAQLASAWTGRQPPWSGEAASTCRGQKEACPAPARLQPAALMTLSTRRGADRFIRPAPSRPAEPGRPQAVGSLLSTRHARRTRPFLLRAALAGTGWCAQHARRRRSGRGIGCERAFPQVSNNCPPGRVRRPLGERSAHFPSFPKRAVSPGSPVPRPLGSARCPPPLPAAPRPRPARSPAPAGHLPARAPLPRPPHGERPREPASRASRSRPACLPQPKASHAGQGVRRRAPRVARHPGGPRAPAAPRVRGRARGPISPTARRGAPRGRGEGARGRGVAGVGGTAPHLTPGAASQPSPVGGKMEPGAGRGGRGAGAPRGPVSSAAVAGTAPGRGPAGGGRTPGPDSPGPARPPLHLRWADQFHRVSPPGPRPVPLGSGRSRGKCLWL